MKNVKEFSYTNCFLFLNKNRIKTDFIFLNFYNFFREKFCVILSQNPFKVNKFLNDFRYTKLFILSYF